MLKKYKAEVVMLQETKKPSIDKNFSNLFGVVGTGIGSSLLHKVQPAECLLLGSLIILL